MLFLFKDPGEVMFIKGSLTTQRFLTAVDMADSSLTEEVSRQLWMRIWSRVRGLCVSTFHSFGKTFHKRCLENVQTKMRQRCVRHQICFCNENSFGVYLLDFFCSGIQFYILLSTYLCFISFLYSDLYVFGDDALIS